jgi:uncharacterized protein HemX
MKIGHKIVIYSFILLLLMYSLATTYYMLNNVRKQYHANKNIQQELLNLGGRSDSIAVQQIDQHQEIATLKNEIDQLRSKIDNIAPAADKIAYYQISTLVNTANQSLLLQDTTTTITLLEYAVQFIGNLHQPIFMQLKNSILQDITILESNKDYDVNFVLVKINNLSKSVDGIFSNRIMQLHNVNSPAVNNVWHRFITNTKNTLFHFWEKTIKTSTNDELLYRQIQLDIMNMKHAVITHDQELWQTSIHDILNLGKTHQLSENEYNLLLSPLNSMLSINIGQEKNLIHTMETMNLIANHVLNGNTNV